MGKFTGILIVSDFDGTFYSPVKESYDKNINQIERFKNHGGIFTFATGRDCHTLLSIEPNAASIINAPAILANGAILCDMNNLEYIFKITLNMRLFSELLEIICEKYPEIGVRFSVDAGMVVPILNDILKNDLDIWSMDNVFLREMPVDKLINSGENVYKCVMIHEPEILDCVRKLAEDFNRANNCEFCFTKTYARGLETVNINASKGAAALRLKEYLANKNNQGYKLFAIGDYDNDLTMIKLADYGAAPENALEYVKQAAKIRTASCSDGAVADLIQIIEREYI
ncbi:MAG: HAD family hydrolase [Oscillospiraceae bacterium]|nr:HAD family hydrolase [Oscillospiraceae bacterium]